MMKCLSLRQPYADLLVSGKKTIELRTWNTKFRGKFLVHASKKIDKEACKKNKINPNSILAGAIIGSAILYDVKFYSNSSLFLKDRYKHLAGTKFFNHKYGFLIKNARRFNKPLFIAGKLGFFNVDV